MHDCFKKAMALVATAAITLLPATPAFADHSQTATPIKHLVVLFQENISFDHYFGTYPNAANPPGEPPFTALPGTPSAQLGGGNFAAPLPGPRERRALDVGHRHDHRYHLQQLKSGPGIG